MKRDQRRKQKDSSKNREEKGLEGRDVEEKAENVEGEAGSTSRGKLDRVSRSCPLYGKVQKYLSTHLTRKHKINDEGKRKKLLFEARQKKPIIWKNEGKNRRRGRTCSLCDAPNLQRLDICLSKKHNMPKGAERRKAT